jgi:hypothetical protein
MTPLCLLGFLCVLVPQGARGPSARPATPYLTTRAISGRIVSQAHAVGRWTLLVRRESPFDPDGADLNGDGDRNDFVLWVHDAHTGATTNLGLANSTTFSPSFVLATAPGRALVAVREASQGQGDLNGDGDTADEVLFGLDLATGAVTSSGFACQRNGNLGTSAAFLGSRVVFTSYEASQGADLDGNGSIGWSAPMVWDSFATTPEALPITLGPNGTFTLSGSWLLAQVPEAVTGDRNADGDAADYVVHWIDVDASVPSAMNTALTVATDTFQPWVEDGARTAFLVSEAQRRRDLNGDGDRADRVLHVLDPAQGVLNLGFAVGEPRVGVVDVGLGLALSSERVAFHVVEASQGASDLNGDGDVADLVLHVHEFATGTTTNLGITGWWFTPGPGALAFSVSELLEGEDLNGDGELESHRAFAYRAASGAVFPLELDVGIPSQAFGGGSPFVFGGAWLAISALGNVEPAAFVDVLRVADLVPVERLLVGPRVAFSPDGWLAYGASESLAGRDLNGDGDAFDNVPTFTRPGSGVRRSTALSTQQTVLSNSAGRFTVLSSGGAAFHVRVSDG